MGRVRDYTEIVRRLRALPQGEWRVDQAGTVWGYPFYCVRRHIHRRAPTIFLTAGIHGEEPGSVEGALRWLENGEWARWRVNWLVLPCINPYGWERNQRRNAQRLDINRQFRDPSACPEAGLVRRLVRGQRFLFMLDFHEDVDASGYYLYELRAGPPFIGERVVRAVGKIIPINRDKVIDGNRATGVALIRREGTARALHRRRRWPMAFHVFLNCTDHVLGSETPVRFPLERRAAAHNVALRTALAALAGPR
ncbi:MAG TPA: M14 family metallocarboxypeptidase [Verrucomicrobiae bacterium]|nr:M14 family metallocarboxypeptidase [Verrucomicrobiae bacterium]